MVHFNTKALHWGYDPFDHNKCLSPPIYQNTSYLFEGIEEAEAFNSGKKLGHVYTRVSNPTTDILERRITALEGGVSSVACSSGHSAQFLVLNTLLKSGDNIVSSPYLYGGTYHQFNNQLPRIGVSVVFADPTDPSAFAAAIQPNTKLLYVESLGNPELNPVDISALASIARQNRIPLVVDNTLGCCGYLIRPIEHGADIVISSLTKWAGGHGNSIGGIVTDSGNFDWSNPKFPQFTEPDSAYNGLSYWDEYGFGGEGCQRFNLPFYKNLAFIVRLRLESMRDWGPCISPFNSFLIIQGLETLGLRAERSSANAFELAQSLSSFSSIQNVRYPGLPTDPYHHLASRMMTNGFGSVLTFELKNGYEDACRLVESTKLFKHAANIGDSKSLILHPASTTHSQLTSSEKLKAGVTPSLIRLSVGIEGIDDLINDIVTAIP